MQLKVIQLTSQAYTGTVHSRPTTYLRCSRAARTSAWSSQVHHVTCGALEPFLQQQLDTAGNLQGHLDAHI